MEATGVLVLLDSADESSIPLELAATVEESSGADLVVCSFHPPDDDTFGVEVCSLGGGSRLDPRPYRLLWELLRDATVVHVHSNAVGAVARVLAAFRGVAVVKTEHNTHASYGWLKNLLNGTTNGLSDAVVTVSEAVASSFGAWEDLVIDLAGGEKTVIHNGVDIEAIRAAETAPLPVDLPEGFVVGCGGRHVPQKNLSAVLEAAGLVADRIDGLHLVVTGDGPERSRLERLAVECGIADRVTFTGYLDERSMVHALYHRLDVFAFPSWHEGFGVAAVEAMAAGVPVLASDIPVLREVVGNAGLYVDPESPERIAATLVELSRDSHRRRELGKTGRERAADRFPLERTAAQYRALYDRLGAGGS